MATQAAPGAYCRHKGAREPDYIPDATGRRSIATSVQSIDKQASLSYNVAMINKIKNAYNTYQPNEFLPIYEDGVLANRRDFHIYKLKRAAVAADAAWMSFVNRAHAK